ncbi:MAG: c-type cytochrome [Bacteroidota bacterium]
MLHRKKLIVFASLAVCMFLGVAAVKAPFQIDRNLKVLPKDIPDAKLDSIMQSYSKALGVSCNFCHVKAKFVPNNNLDYASDAEPMKENARDMMKMVIEINQKNFYFDKNERPEYLHTVTCKTCHRGQAFPPED